MTGALCPACSVALRPFGARLCCDRCEGIFLAEADLVRAVDELIAVEPVLTFTDEAAGARACPACRAAMQTCKLRLAILDKVLEPRITLDRCAPHGVWFDGGELAEVFLAVERKFGSHGSTPQGSGTDGPLGSYGKFNAPP